MVKSLLDYYAYTKSYLILKFKNVVKFHVHIHKTHFLMLGHNCTSHVHAVPTHGMHACMQGSC